MEVWKDERKQACVIENQNGRYRCSFSNFDKVGYIIVFIDNLSEIAQHAQQLKLASLGRLTASIAHEIRNPLSTISFTNQLLCESEDIAETDKQLLQTSEINVSRINNIIRDILSVSRAETSEPEKIDVIEFLYALKREYKPLQDAARIEILTKGEPPFITPFGRHQLRQVLVNLIDNGLRYSLQSTGIASVHIHILKTDNQSIELTVINQGESVSKENRSKLFEPFFTTEKNGTGLGLYLSKEICTLNQASLSYHCPEEENGSHFTIRFSHPDRDIMVNIDQA